MRIAIPREVREDERRVALSPESCKKLIKAGVTVSVQRGAGVRSFFSDDQYAAAGAQLEDDVATMLGRADFVFKVQPPQEDESADRHEADLLREGGYLLCSLVPARSVELIRKLAARKVSAFSLESIPRSTRAQSMDTLSSMANIAGYKAVLIAANELCKYFPLFMTAAGTVFAAKVFVIGAGVAGLQAIATARRLGATVEATDVRASVREEVASVGAKFVTVESSERGDAAGGYAKEMSAEFQKLQAALIAKHCAASDVVITTALIGGVRAPKLIPTEVVDAMRPGSVIIDLAAEGGGNCTLTQPGQTVEHRGVKICAPLNLPSTMPRDASTLWSRNLTTFFLEFWKDGQFRLDRNDEIQAGSLLTHEGQIVHGPTRQMLGMS